MWGHSVARTRRGRLDGIFERDAVPRRASAERLRRSITMASHSIRRGIESEIRAEA